MEPISREEFQKLEHSVDKIGMTLQEVHGAIVGNPLSEDGGMRKRLFKAEEDLEELRGEVTAIKEKQIKYNVYTVIMWASLGGVAMAIFMYVVNLIIKK